MLMVPHAALPMVSASAGVYDRSIDMCRRSVFIRDQCLSVFICVHLCLSVAFFCGLLLWRSSAASVDRAARAQRDPVAAALQLELAQPSAPNRRAGAAHHGVQDGVAADLL